jgi:hypothetical protein
LNGLSGILQEWKWLRNKNILPSSVPNSEFLAKVDSIFVLETGIADPASEGMTALFA